MPDPQRLWWLPSGEDRKLCAWRALGVGIAILSMETLAGLGGVPFARVPFVTSIVLVMSYPDSEAAQPRAILAGHLLSSLAGLMVLSLAGPGELAAAGAVALAAFAMLLARSPHPPAGLDAFLIVHNELSVWWIVSPVLLGAVLLAVFGRLRSNASCAGERRSRRFAVLPAAGAGGSGTALVGRSFSAQLFCARDRAMPKCDVCGNDYDKAFTVTMDGRSMTFDCFECAIHALAPACGHCGCRVIGHGLEAGGAVFCCAHCAAQSGFEGVGVVPARSWVPGQRGQGGEGLSKGYGGSSGSGTGASGPDSGC